MVRAFNDQNSGMMIMVIIVVVYQYFIFRYNVKIRPKWFEILTMNAIIVDYIVYT